MCILCHILQAVKPGGFFVGFVLCLFLRGGVLLLNKYCFNWGTGNTNLFPFEDQ